MSAQSLILITVDCLRADHVGFLGYSRRPTTPFLDSLANESFVVSNAIVGGVPTYYSLPAILASRHPLALGRDLIGIAPKETTLTSHLKNCGLTTACFLAGNPYLSAAFGYDQGFEVFTDYLDHDSGNSQPHRKAQSNGRWSDLNRAMQRMSRPLAPIGELYRELYFQYCQLATPMQDLNSLRPFPAADSVVDAACQWLQGVGDQPFFLWLHLMDPHAPHYPPDSALQSIGVPAISARRARYINTYWNRRDLPLRRLGKLRDAIVDLYDAGISWVDLQLRRLVQALQASGAWDQCTFALTADHGEEFLEHGARFHSPWTMKEELIRVPLLVRIPGKKGVRLTETPFSHLDLAPTLMDSMNLPIPTEFRGQSRWREWVEGKGWDTPALVDSTECTLPNQRETRCAARVLCIRERRYKLILRLGGGADELFDLQADPSETSPLPQTAERPTRKRLLDHARRHLESTTSAVDVDIQLRGRLRNLHLKLSEAIAPIGAIPS